VNDSPPNHDLTRTVVRPEHQGARVDVYLASATELSRRAARRLLSDGGIWLNGRPIRVQSRTLVTGDVVDILRRPAELGMDGNPPPASPSMLHEDSWLLAAAKPPGVLSAPAEKMRPGELSLDQQVLLSLAFGQGRRPYLHVVHRLDRMTSGVMVFSRHSEANAPLAAAWKSGRVARSYVAVVEGHPGFEKTIIDEPIGRDRSHAWRFIADPHGKPAATEVEVAARLEGDLAVVRCTLITGRTHQVRVHLASAGHSVLGDRLYGSTRCSPPDRPLLHAHSISLPHPRTGKTLQVICPFPADMEEYGRRIS
jgi:23S rRNA pseudouridine1911/1915/1917 synthase